MRVSIRSPDRSPERHGEALALTCLRQVRGFQSRSPDPSPERLTLKSAEGWGWQVSIPLSGPEPGETETRAMLYTYRICFNPLSGPEPGETGEDNQDSIGRRSFNPLSGPEPGETGASTRRQWSSDAVSIRSPDRSPERPEQGLVNQGQRDRGFNPLSGPEPGET